MSKSRNPSKVSGASNRSISIDSSAPVHAAGSPQVGLTLDALLAILPLRRVSPPPLAPSSVRRPNLTDRVRQVSPGGLVVISGPPGSGRTTVMAEAFHECDSHERSTTAAWLTVVAGAEDAFSLIDLVVYSIHTADSSLVPQTVEYLRAGPDASDANKLAVLANELHLRERHVCIFIDGAQLLAEDDRSILRQLLDGAPDAVSVVLSTGGRSPIALATFRLRGQLHEIDGSELAFCLQEVTELTEAAGLHPAPRLAARLHERTGGWAAGVALGLSTLVSSDDAAGALEDLSGSNPLLEEFYRERVMDIVDPSVAEFLIETADLTRMSAGLCNAVRQRTDSAEVLDSLVNQGLFIDSMDGLGMWFSYQPLFAEYLKRRVAAGSRLAEERDGRAVAWLRQAGMTAEAVRYSVDHGDHRVAVETLRTSWESVLQSEHFVVMVHALSQLSDSPFLDSPPVAAAVALANAVSGDASLATQSLNSLAEQQHVWTQTLLLMRAILAPEGVQQRRENAAAAHAFEAEASEMRIQSALLLGSAESLSGDFDRAKALLLEASSDAVPVFASLAFAERSLMAMEKLNDQDDALETAMTALKFANDSGTDLTVVGAMANAAAAWALASTNADQAHEHFLTADELINTVESTMPIEVHRVRLALVDAAITLDDVEAAQNQLDAIPDRQRSPVDYGRLKSSFADLQAKVIELRESRRRERIESLTERETQILALLRRPMSTREIGEELYLSVNTIKTYLRRIYRKLDVSSRHEAVSRAISSGLLPQLDSPPPDVLPPH